MSFHLESSKAGSAQSNFPVAGSTGESPIWNFHGPFSGKDDRPRVMPGGASFIGFESALAPCAAAKMPQANSNGSMKADRKRRGMRGPFERGARVARTIPTATETL